MCLRTASQVHVSEECEQAEGASMIFPFFAGCVFVALQPEETEE